jgi:hypothetical protein
MITELRGRPAYTPPKNVFYGRPPSTLDMGDAFSVYANPDPQSTRVVTLIAPPLYFSKNSYSTPLTMPLGLAYLAAVLDKAHYRVKIVDCPGSGANHIYYIPNGRFKAQGMDEQRSIELIDLETDIIGVSIMFSQEWPQVRDYITRIRRAFPYAKIISGRGTSHGDVGVHAARLPRHRLSDLGRRGVDPAGSSVSVTLWRALSGGQWHCLPRRRQLLPESPVPPAWRTSKRCPGPAGTSSTSSPISNPTLPWGSAMAATSLCWR